MLRKLGGLGIGCLIGLVLAATWPMQAQSLPQILGYGRTTGGVNTPILVDSQGRIKFTGTTTAVCGSNTQVQFNDAGACGASASLTFNKATGRLTTALLTAASLIYPAADGSAGDCIQTNGSGTLSFGACGGGGGTPGGSTTQVQYNNAGEFGGFGAWDQATGLAVPGALATGDNPIAGTVQAAYDQAAGPADAFTTTIGINRTITALPTEAEGYFTNYPFLVGALVNLTDDTPQGFVYGAASLIATAVGNTKNLSQIAGGDWEANHMGDGALDAVIGSYNTAKSSGAGTVGKVAAVYALPVVNNTSTVTEAYGTWIDVGGVDGAVTLYGTWSGAMGGKATNPYALWADEQGVFRLKADNTFNSVYQAIPALYNPQFTKYTPGAANFERIVFQWESNVGVLTTEAGGTGTLRALRIGDTGVDTSFGGVIQPTGYKSSDGSAGVTVAACTSFKNGLCVAGT